MLMRKGGVAGGVKNAKSPGNTRFKVVKRGPFRRSLVGIVRVRARFVHSHRIRARKRSKTTASDAPTLPVVPSLSKVPGMPKSKVVLTRADRDKPYSVATDRRGKSDEADGDYLALLAGFGGGCMSTDAKKEPVGFGTVHRGVQVPGVMGPGGEPVMAARGAMPGGSGIAQAGGMMKADSRVVQAGLLDGNDCCSCAHVPGASAPLFGPHFSKHGSGMGGGYGGDVGGGGYQPGIFPVPGQGPPGAVAAVGAIMPGMGGGFGGGGGTAMATGRTSIKFIGPAGMKITWQLPDGEFNDESAGLTAPKEYNFLQGQVYRLRLTQILPDHPGKSFYPTLEVAPANPKTLTFLAHSSVPLVFTARDFQQAVAGNLVVKVIYLPDATTRTSRRLLGRRRWWTRARTGC